MYTDTLKQAKKQSVCVYIVCLRTIHVCMSALSLSLSIFLYAHSCVCVCSLSLCLYFLYAHSCVCVYTGRLLCI